MVESCCAQECINCISVKREPLGINRANKEERRERKGEGLGKTKERTGEGLGLFCFGIMAGLLRAEGHGGKTEGGLREM